jgi:hypothetical protein
MQFAGLSVGVTRKKRFKIFCLVSNSGSVDGRLNQLRAISFKDQPRVGHPTMDKALQYAQSLPAHELTQYVEGDRLPSKGVHVDQQEYEGKYIYKLLHWSGARWELPADPQMEFDFLS